MFISMIMEQSCKMVKYLANKLTVACCLNGQWDISGKRTKSPAGVGPRRDGGNAGGHHSSKRRIAGVSGA